MKRIYCDGVIYEVSNDPVRGCCLLRNTLTGETLIGRELIVSEDIKTCQEQIRKVVQRGTHTYT